MSFFVDVHTHLTHKDFAKDCDQVIRSAIQKGLGAIVVNGLEPKSNRQILQMAEKYPEIKAACGIYPVDAVHSLLPKDFPHPVASFDLDAEISFIAEKAKLGKLAAVGECGLDGHWLKEETFKLQEEVFERLIVIAKTYDIPVIIHSRKLEQRTIDVLKNHRPSKVIFHCFGGRSKLALKTAEEENWSFSIPANAQRNEAFKKMLKILPLDCLLTETDAPYLSPIRNTRNTPESVIETIKLLANLRGFSNEEAKDQVWQNYSKLFK